MNGNTGKLSPHLTWAFAFGAVALGVGLAWAIPSMPPKVSAAVYAAIVGVAGFASTFLTRARVRGAVLAFFVAAIACAALYYGVVSHIMGEATKAVVDASGGDQPGAGAAVGGTFGKFFGTFAAVIAFLETFAVGVAGAVAGGKARERGSLTARADAATSAMRAR